jgi:quinol monooxygenase YgiN
MTSWTRVLLAVSLLLIAHSSAFAQDVQAPPLTGPVYIVTFIDVRPVAEDQAISALREYRDATRKETANVTADVYRELGPQNRFMLIETWREQTDFDAHLKGPAGMQLNIRLRPIELAPADVRNHRGFLVGAKLGNPAANTIYAMTHLDVAPPAFAALGVALKPFVDASRSERGVLRFDILQHIEPRQNHLTMLEAWRSRGDFDEHVSAEHTHGFRGQLDSILGALYDQRLYALVQ